MKKHIISIFAFAAVFLIILINVFTGVIDRKVLLEKSNSGYYYYLKHDRGFRAQIEKNESKSLNWFVNTLSLNENGGMKTAPVSDGSIILTGTAAEDIDLVIGEMFYPENTEYTVWTDNIFCTPESYITISGRSGESETVLFHSAEDASFTPDPALYESFTVVLHIRKNTEFKNMSCRIMIRKEMNNTDSYIPCLLKIPESTIFPDNSQLLIYQFDKKILSELKYSDFCIFFNNMDSFHRKNYDAVILDFMDGTGILFPSCHSDNAAYGVLSPDGNISTVFGSLRNTGSYLYIEDLQGNPLTPDKKTSGINGTGIQYP